MQKIRSVIVTFPLKFSEKLLEYKYNKFIEKKRLHLIDKISTHLTKREKLKLYQLASQKQGTFVEIGSYLGASSCFISEGIMRNVINNSYLYCIDTWENNAMTEGIKDTFSEFRKNTEKYDHIIRPLRGWSYNVINDFRKLNLQINFLFIDGDHSYEGVKKDWDLYSPLLANDAIVLFHDIGWAEGVKQVVQNDVMPFVKEYGTLPNLWWGKL